MTVADTNDPLSLPIHDFNRDLAINTTSALAAAQQAVAIFERLPSTASKTFIYTGNILNDIPIASYLSLGIGKSASAHFIQAAADAYSDRGFK